MTKYIAYYRVSTRKQGNSGLGLDAQKETVRSLTGEDPIAEFVEVESGRKRNRPKLAEALAAAKKEGATLVVAKLDRLARNARFLLEIQDAGVEIMFCDLPQLNGHMGKFIVTIFAAVAELESGMVSDRVTKALAQSKKRGVVLGVTGKDRAMENKAKSHDFAKQVEPHIISARACGKTSAVAVAGYLNDNSIPTQNNGTWHPMTVKRVMERLSQ